MRTLLRSLLAIPIVAACTDGTTAPDRTTVAARAASLSDDERWVVSYPSYATYSYSTASNEFLATFSIPAGTPSRVEQPSDEQIAGVESFFQAVGRAAELVSVANGLELGGGCVPGTGPCDPWQPTNTPLDGGADARPATDPSICTPLYYTINTLAAQATTTIEQLRETTGSMSDKAGEIAPTLLDVAGELQRTLWEWQAYACSPFYAPGGGTRVGFEPSMSRRPAVRKMVGTQWFYNTVTGYTFSRQVYWSERSWSALGSSAPLWTTNVAPDVQ